MLATAHLTEVTASIQVETMRNWTINGPCSKSPGRKALVCIIKLQYLSNLVDCLGEKMHNIFLGTRKKKKEETIEKIHFLLSGMHSAVLMDQYNARNQGGGDFHLKLIDPN